MKPSTRKPAPDLGITIHQRGHEPETLKRVARELLDRFVHFDECARNPIETSYSARRYRVLATEALHLHDRYEREARAASKQAKKAGGRR